MTASPKIRHLVRSLAFWLGLPVVLFVFWAWRDSMHRSATLHWGHGTPFSLRWPPVDPSRLQASKATQFPSIDEAMEEIEFDLQTLPGALGPLSPITRPPLRIIDDPFRNSPWTRMHPYHSIGSSGGALWISSWISPRKLNWWEIKPASSPESGFARLDWSRTQVTHNTTLWIPYWLVAAIATASWIAVVGWSLKRSLRRAMDLEPS
jgi:hypothetical protein